MSKKNMRWLLVIIVLILVSVFAVYVYFAIRDKRIVPNKAIVSSSDIIGVDISSYQADIDMTMIKNQNVKFAYIKATEGSNHVDPRFSTNWKNAQDVGLLAGAYHFFSYDSSGYTQAQNYIKTVGSLDDRLIPAVDVEYYKDKEKNPPEKSEVVKELKVFLDELEREYGVKPMIYTRPDIHKKYLRGEFDEYKKWISSIYYPISWNYKDEWYLWQYTDRGELNGYSGGEKYIDLNVLNSKYTLESLKIE